MRLVPNQDWQEIGQLFENILRYRAEECKREVTTHHGGEPYVPLLTIVAIKPHKAYATTFGVEPFPQRGGGSIPIIFIRKSARGKKCFNGLWSGHRRDSLS